MNGTELPLALNKKNNGVVPPGTAPLVFWDGYGLQQPYSGISYYAQNLYLALKTIGVSPYLVAPAPPFFSCDNSVLPAAEPFKKIMNSKLVWPGRSFAKATELAEKAGKSAVFHGLSNITVPMRKKAGPPTVVTIHDLIPLLAPRLVSTAYYLQFAFAVERIVHAVDQIVAVSDWTAETLKERFPKSAGKIMVIKNGRPAAFRAVRKNPSGGPLAVLTVSRFEPYKNLSVIGEIALRSEKKMTFDLVSDQRASTFFRQHYRALVENGTIKLHVNLGENEIDRLYESSDCYFQPSLYEGFCLPVVKAASFAVPVAFLKGSAIDEVALPEFSVGAAKNDADSFLDAIQMAVSKRENPVFYENIKVKFLQFSSWDDAALRLKNLYTALSTSR